MVADADGKSVIDWKFVSTVVNYYENGNKHRVTGEPFIFRDEDFADAVISPVYRNSDQPQYFYVAEICSDLNPKSPFPSPELFDTFYEYYTSKYNVKITNVTQPLIDVDHTSARLNLLTPRYVNQKGVALPTSSAEMRRQRRENLQQKQILIPELCAIHPVPASMWRKVVLLPTVLYRLNYLLIAEELRVLIARRTSVGSASLPADFRFPRLHFSFGDPVPSAAADSGAMESIEKTSGVQEPAGDKELPANDAAIVENSELGGATVNGHNLPDSAHGDIMTDAKVKVNGLCDDIAALKLSNGDHKSSNENGENAVNFALKTVSSEEATRLTLNLDQDYSANISTGPSPCIILQTLTMSNANDFFNLERLETIGDSFLKFAITVYLYCSYPGIHEGKLSYLRSKQVSNYNLYKLGRRKGLPERMVPIKFEPSENWLPPGYVIRKEGAFRDLNVQLAPSFTDSQDKTTSSTSEVTEVNCSDDTDDDHGVCLE
jgi:endoribonuclease Dicer